MNKKTNFLFGALLVASFFVPALAADLPKVEVTGKRPIKFDAMASVGIFAPQEIGGGSGGAGPITQGLPVAEANSKTCPSTLLPVIIMTGEKYKPEPDFKSGGVYGLD